MKNKSLLYLLIITSFILLSAVEQFGQQIYFVDNQSAKVQKSETNGSGLTQFKLNSLGLYGVAVDYVNHRVYYSNVVTDEIYRTEFDGTHTIVIDNNTNNGVDGPRGIAVDNKNNKIYWAESISGKIRSADLNGNNVTDLITGLIAPVDVALDLVNSKLYWTDNGGSQKKIGKSELDGTLPTYFSVGPDQLNGLELDVENNKLFFVYFGYVYVINTDFTSPSIFVGISNGSPRGLAIDRYSSKLFWTDVSDSSINSINLDGTLQTKIVSNLDHPIGISGDNPGTLPVLVQLKTFLEGPYLGSNLMSTDLNTMLPTTSPYSENIRSIDSMPTDISDWVLVQLKTSATGAAVASKSVLLRKDGKIVDDDGVNETVKINADPASYYIEIKHRNHLSIMSHDPVSLTTN